MSWEKLDNKSEEEIELETKELILEWEKKSSDEDIQEPQEWETKVIL